MSKQPTDPKSVQKDPAKKDGRYAKISYSEPRPQTANGRKVVDNTATTTISRADLGNSRNDPAGRAEDKKVRRAIANKIGWHAGHRVDLASGANPGDKKNVRPENPFVNQGVKASVERQRAKALRNDPELLVKLATTDRHDPKRPGYGDKIPIAETVEQTWIKKGKIVSRDKITLGNFKTPAVRYAEQQRAQGLEVDPKEIKKLDSKFRQTMKKEGRGSVQQATEQAKGLRTQPRIAPQLVSRTEDKGLQPTVDKASPQPTRTR